MAKVFANGRSIVHAGDGRKHVSAPPDVCKTPAPSGPTPAPYVNIASNSNLAKGTKKTKINRKSVALESSNIKTSSGDEPGTAGGGLVSAKTKGKMTWGSASASVKFEGKGVARFMDVTHHNGNSFNATFTTVGGTGFAYADDFEGKCCICNGDPDSHAILERPEGSLETARKILDDLKTREARLSALEGEITSVKVKLNRLQKGSTPVKPQTLAGLESAISTLESQIGPYSSHRRENSNGYMFGVMVCKTGKKFAAVSGNEMPTGFKEIAAKHGCTPIEDAATLDDLIAANPRCASGDAVAIGAMRTQWQGTMKAHIWKQPGYNNQPGTCAGAKLVGKSGHVADSLTEIYFSFSVRNKRKTLTFDTFYRGPEEFAPTSKVWEGPPNKASVERAKSSYVDKRVTMKRRKETTVPSCQSCQDTLFMARCDLSDQSCG